MGFEGTISLSSETIQKVMVDRINQETAGIAVDLGSAVGPLRDRERLSSIPDPGLFDRHAGVGETSRALTPHPKSSRDPPGSPGEPVPA